MGVRNKLSRAESGKLGGLARIARRGNPGTAEGRSRGGKNSIAIQRLRSSQFKTLRTISVPEHSPRLAELFGVLAGDGHINEYQISVTTHAETDTVHAIHVQQLIENLFGITASFYHRKNKNAVAVVASSRALSNFLVQHGLIRGSKVRKQLAPPLWITQDQTFTQWFVRGLFDTDGCVFVDTHTIKGKQYRSVGMAFSNRSKPLLKCFKEYLESIGLHPTQKTDFVVFLRRKNDIKHYFEVVGSSNSKHLKKYSDFLQAQYGRVA